MLQIEVEVVLVVPIRAAVVGPWHVRLYCGVVKTLYLLHIHTYHHLIVRRVLLRGTPHRRVRRIPILFACECFHVFRQN